MAASYESEVTFLSGVGENGTVARVSFDTWNGNIPAGYDQSASSATKWGDPWPGTGASISYFFDAASNWTAVEKAAWQGGMALWSAVANVTFTEAASSNTANFAIIRGSDGAFHQFARAGNLPAIGSTSLATPADTGTIISMDTRNAELGPIGADMLVHGGRPLSVMVHELGLQSRLGARRPVQQQRQRDDAAVQRVRHGGYGRRCRTSGRAIRPPSTSMTIR